MGNGGSNKMKSANNNRKVLVRISTEIEKIKLQGNGKRRVSSVRGQFFIVSYMKRK